MRKSEDIKNELAAILEEIENRQQFRVMDDYMPGRRLAPTIRQREFHEAGAKKRHRLLTAGNQLGKTTSGGMEIAYHMTGLYPSWWKGKRWDGPIKCWAGGVTVDTTRDNPQRILLGEKKEWGTGTIPKELLVGTPTMSRGYPETVDSFQVKHVKGGVSTCWFKSYERGREKWQGQTLHVVWFDEEPPYDVYSEGITRLNKLKGISFITATPLLGMTKVCQLFFEPKPSDAGIKQRAHILMGIKDATFYPEEQKEEIIAQYPEHERRARVEGLPIFGEGLIFPFNDAMLACDPFPIPTHYRRVCGFDFGLLHPTAACWMAWDVDTDTVFVYDAYVREDINMALHSSAVRQRGVWIPVAWPHDGLKREPKSGQALKDIYRLPPHGMLMMPDSARYQNDKGGPQSVEPIIIQTIERMQEGRLKVFKSAGLWFEGKGKWFRKGGKPVAYNDDLMKAMLYGLMMLRFARPNSPLSKQAFAVSSYDPLA